MNHKITAYSGKPHIKYAELAFLVVLASALRLYRLGTESLWIDEGYSIRDAAHLDAIPKIRPLYYALLHFWMELGHSVIWLRLPSVLFGIGCVIMLYLLASYLFNSRIGFLASLFMAICPLHIDHSQEIRMYTLATFLVLVEAYYFLQFIRTRSTKHLIGCIVTSALAGLTHPLTLFMFPAVDLFLAATYRDLPAAATRWFSVQAVLGVISVPAGVFCIKSLHDFANQWSWGAEIPGLLSILSVMRDFTVWQIPPQYPRIALLGDVYGAFTVALMCYAIPVAYKQNRWQVLFVTYWLAVPILLTLVVSRCLGNIWMVRYMLYASPAYYMLIALGLSSIKGTAIRRLLIAGILLLLVARLGVYHGKLHRPEWKSAVRYIEHGLKNTDSIALFGYGNIYDFGYYYRGKAPYIGLGPKEYSREAVKGWTDVRISKMLSDIPQKGGRTWFAILRPMGVGEVELENYIQRNYRVLDIRHFTRIDVYLAVLDTRPSAHRELLCKSNLKK